MWRSLVAYAHGVRVVAGSNPVIPTEKIHHKSDGFFISVGLELVLKPEGNKKTKAARPDDQNLLARFIV